MYDEIQSTLAKKSINIIQGDIYDIIAIWKQWYRGNVNDFHYYNVKLADGKETQCERLTMNMPKKVCEDFAKLEWSEKVQIKLDDEAKEKELWNILDSKKNNFSVMFPQFIEKTFALGTGAVVQYLVDDEVKIDYIDGDNVIPYKYDNGVITGFVNLNQFTEGLRNKKKYYTHLTYHEYDGVKYKKWNELYCSKDKNTLGREVSFEDMFPKVKNPVEYETEVPHFQILKPNLANNLDFTTPMGMSIFGNHIDKFKSIDTKYDIFNKEFELGKKRILVDKSAIKSSPQVDTDGNITNITYFDKNDQVYQAINGMESQPVKEIDFKLRHREFIESINADLNYLSAGVGLGQNYYSFDASGVKTATEVISENSDTYRAKVHHQIMVKDVLFDLIKVVMYLGGIESKELEIIFDDSIIEDTNSIMDRGLKLLSSGAISKSKFMEKYLGYTEQEITKELAKIKEENKVITPDGLDFF